MHFSNLPQTTFLHTDPDAGKIAHQVLLEHLYNKNQLIPRIRQEFETCKEFDFQEYLADHKIPIPFGIDLLIQMALHKRVGLAPLVGILKKHFETANDPAQTCADMLERALEADLIQWMGSAFQFIVVFDITAELQRELDMFQFPLPMIVQPRPVTNNREDGYITINRSLLLKKTHHDDDICLDHINRVNKIAFVINFDTAQMVANKWRNLDRQKASETIIDFRRRKKAFEKYDRTAKDVLKLLLKESNKFYLTHKYDKRGRIYCQGYHVNYQGAPWNKAVIELAEKEMVL